MSNELKSYQREAFSEKRQTIERKQNNTLFKNIRNIESRVK